MFNITRFIIIVFIFFITLYFVIKNAVYQAVLEILSSQNKFKENIDNKKIPPDA